MNAKSCHDPRCGNESFHSSMRMPERSNKAVEFTGGPLGQVTYKSVIERMWYDHRDLAARNVLCPRPCLALVL